MFDKKYLMKKTTLIGFVGIVLLIVGNLIPIVHIDSDTLEYSKSFTFVAYEGRYIIFAAMITLGLLLFHEEKTSLAPNFVISILLAYLLLNRSSLYDHCSFYEDMFSWGIGVYVLVIGNILTYIPGIYSFFKERFTLKAKTKENKGV